MILRQQTSIGMNYTFCRTVPIVAGPHLLMQDRGLETPVFRLDRKPGVFRLDRSSKTWGGGAQGGPPVFSLKLNVMGTWAGFPPAIDPAKGPFVPRPPSDRQRPCRPPAHQATRPARVPHDTLPVNEFLTGSRCTPCVTLYSRMRIYQILNINIGALEEAAVQASALC